MTIFISVDPGLTGAIAALNHHGEPIAALDMPTMMNGSGKAKVKQRVNPAALREVLLQLCPADEKCIVFIEKVMAMRAQGVSSVFSLGHTAGVIEATVASLHFPYELVTPQSWKKHFNLGSDKEQARALAIQLFPTMPLDRKKDHNRSEALLLAKFALDTRA